MSKERDGHILLDEHVRSAIENMLDCAAREVKKADTADDQYRELYRPGRHETTRSDGLRVAFGNDHVCGVFVQVWNPANGNDCEDLLVDVDERFEGETVVRDVYAEWVLGDV